MSQALLSGEPDGASAAPGVDGELPRVLCLGRGYAVRFAGWVLARSGLTVTYAVARSAHRGVPASWPAPAEVWDDQQVAAALAGTDVCLADDLTGLGDLVDGEQPWPSSLGRLVLVELRAPCADDDANARIAEQSGVGAVIGEADGAGREPPGRMLEAMVGLQAATAAMAGWLGAIRDGAGEHVVVDPVRCVAVMSGVNAIQFLNYGRPWRRAGPSASGSGGPWPFRLFRCHDGWVVVICRARAEWEAFVQLLGDPPWAAEERFADPLVVAEQHAEEATELVTAVLAARTVAEVVAQARELRVPLAAVRDLDEALADPRLFVVPTPGVDDELGRSAPVPVWPVTADPVSRPSAWPRSTAPAGAPGRSGPLSGLRVLDLGWVWAAPIASAWLADLGADVVKVESLSALDVARRRGVEFPAGIASQRSSLPGHERAWLFNATNRNKRSVRLELKEPADRAQLLRLVAEADVLVESFAAGVLDRLGISPSELLRHNERLLVVSMGGQTVDGEYAARSYAPILSAAAGLEAQVRDDAGRPIGLLSWGAADPNAGAWAAYAVLAALVSGQSGRHLLLSQLRALVCTCVDAYRRPDEVPASLTEAPEVTLAHLQGRGDGGLGDVYRDVLTRGWSPELGERWALGAPWRFRRMRVGVDGPAPALGSTPAEVVEQEWEPTLVPGERDG